MSVKVYNPAGEIVDTIFVGAVDHLPLSIKLSLTAMVAGIDTLAIDFGASISASGNILYWDGSQNSGQLINSGIYEIKMEITDSFGNVSSISKLIQVLEAPGAGKLTIFNSAGEEVYSQALSTTSGVISGLDLESNVLALGSSGASVPLKGTLHTGVGSQPWTWNGLNSAGVAVSPGVYMIHVYSGSGSKSSAVSVKQITVILDKDGGVAALNPHVVPNPVLGSTLLAGQPLVVKFDPASGSLRGKIYNLAGELVAQSVSAASTGFMEFRINLAASGIYLVALDYLDGNGRASRATLKLVILR